MAQSSRSFERKTSENPIFEEVLNNDFPNFKRPKILGHFSINKNREYVPDITQLKYFYWPKNGPNSSVNFDLNVGIENCVRKPEDLDEKIDHLLQFILSNFKRLHDPSLGNKLIFPDFVCFRGLLTHMMDSIYHDEPWSMLATNWRGTIYLSELKNKPTYNIPKEKMDMFCSWGYKFEQYLLSDTFDTPPNTQTPVVESEEFCAVFSTKLNTKMLMYGAEMDGIVTDGPIKEPVKTWDDVEFVEMKTSRRIDSYKQDYNFRRHKLIKWWAQSFLVGIEKIYCGFRNDRGIVRNVEQYTVKDLPKNAANWKPNVAMNLCNRFLDVIRDTIPPSSDPRVTWRIDWKHRNGNYCIETWSTDDSVSVLPHWYTERISKYL